MVLIIRYRAIYVLLFVSVVCVLWFSSCQKNQPKIIAPLEYNIGDDFSLIVEGLSPNSEYELIAVKKDVLDREWQSSATFSSDKNGSIDLNRDRPLNGSYGVQDVYGLFWSMNMTSELDDDWTPPEPKDFSEVEFLIIEEGDTLTELLTRQYVIPESVTEEALNNEFIAKIFRPSKVQKDLPGILLLGGSGGGLAWAERVGALLANEGYITMALAYFNSGDLPEHLAQLPLEYVDKAIDHLERLEGIDGGRIGVLGYSKGAELALLMASRDSRIKSVCAIAPGSAVFQGFKPPTYPVISSWSENGEDLDFVPNAYDKRFFETYDGMYLWYRTLAQHDEFDKAAIPAEQVNGDILLISGVKDKIWPSTFMAEQIVARLNVAEFENTVEHKSYPDAGHGIAEPPGHPTTTLSDRMGGSAQGNAQAREAMWHEVKSFFTSSFATY